MPIYEYRCEPCDQTFESLIRRSEDQAKCPSCGASDVARVLSAPAAARAAGGAAPALPMAGGGCGRPQCGTGGCMGLN